MLQRPSRLGKTVFARTLAPPGTEVLELNRAAGTEPELRAYRLTRHGLILFDEISAPVVCKQRKLFSGLCGAGSVGVLRDELSQLQRVRAQGSHGVSLQRVAFIQENTVPG